MLPRAGFLGMLRWLVGRCHSGKFNVNTQRCYLILGFPERKDIFSYMLILSKLCIWECRGANCSLTFNLWLYKNKVKKETERCIAVKNGTLDFNKRLGLFLHWEVEGLKKHSCHCQGTTTTSWANGFKKTLVRSQFRAKQTANQL